MRIWRHGMMTRTFKRMHRFLLLVSLAMGLGGCASQLTAAFTRPWRTDTMPGRGWFDGSPVDRSDIITGNATAERRLIIARVRRDPIRGPEDRVLCAESLPDAAQAIAARDALAVSQSLASGRTTSIELDTQVRTALLQTFQRTELAELSRQLAWQVCLAYANGALTTEEYRTQLIRIIDGSFRVMERRIEAAPTPRRGSVAPETGQPRFRTQAPQAQPPQTSR